MNQPTPSEQTNANLYTLFASRFPADVSRTFIETPTGRRWSYGDLERETARFAQAFGRLGLRKGERIVVSVEKSPEALFVYLACLRAGIIYVPLNTAYQAREVDYFLADAEPGVIVCRPEALASISELANRRGIEQVFTLDEQGKGTFVDKSGAVEPGNPFDTIPCQEDDVAALLYTSGTTGKPKGAMLTHGNLASNALALHDAWRWSASDVLLHALPLFHAHGLFVACHGALLSGAGMFLLPGFEVESVLAYLPRATVFMGVPTYYNRLLAEPEFSSNVCGSMRLFISGSAPLSENTFHAFRERAGHTILERYGMTETLMNTSNPYDGERRPGSVGSALPGIAVRVEDGAGEDMVGEIQIKGPNVFSGYWRLPEKTAREFTPDGWFRSGDLGKMDKDGYLFIVGRGKDLIITGGFNVYPREVEGALDRLDGVGESAVIGIPDPDFGEKVIAVVVRESEGEVVTEEGVINALKKMIANYKVPKRVLFVEDFPRNAMGKVQKNVLREAYADSPDF
uniref:Malonyl-CoA/methylmalonyl-CoA synthetase n=1 Tax=Candidatus Kentrum sp. MB TaxID=2138164 RepID=A0A450XA93_9GAMM|nr:MAG: malonyl-CoA/methylmalonyl-CoA synthetase [Candidatus Kentron sp. MB]VFK31302.1 MAG: malonyl-CoA/methylmalonyl-CoA synthetase [Candidatus Kentron sp. MB]VFK75426.1 MAG: malonyl-CoA/methylmalonyl-CoA synthetase [Candidatus Kentron sp. MB]